MHTQLFAKEIPQSETTTSLHLSQQNIEHKVKRPILSRTQAWLADPNFYAAIVQRGPPHLLILIDETNDKEAIFFLSPINDNSPSINTTTCSSFQNNRPNCHVWFIAKTTKHVYPSLSFHVFCRTMLDQCMPSTLEKERRN